MFVLIPAFWGCVQHKEDDREGDEKTDSNKNKKKSSKPKATPKLNWKQLAALIGMKARDGYDGNAGNGCLLVRFYLSYPLF